MDKKEEKTVENLPEVQEKREVARSEESSLQVFDISSGNLPDLSEQFAQALPIDLMADYWTPENIGESKRVFFTEIKERTVLDQESGELFDLECAFFIEQKESKELVQISNGSKRLVAALESNKIKKGTPLLITYMGKKRNKSNAYSSDNWSVKPLIIKT